MTGVFLGRRKIGGMSPGRKLVLEGVVLPDGKQRQIYNPVYTLLCSSQRVAAPGRRSRSCGELHAAAGGSY